METETKNAATNWRKTKLYQSQNEFCLFMIRIREKIMHYSTSNLMFNKLH